MNPPSFTPRPCDRRTPPVLSTSRQDSVYSTDDTATMASSKAVIPVLVGMMLLTGVCNTLLTKYQVSVHCQPHSTPLPLQH